MADENLAPSNSVNRHYLDKVMDLADERDVAATEDIFDARGMKLISKGARISRAMEQKLIVHKLRKPLESCIGLDGGIDIKAIVAEARRLAEAVEPVGYILASANRGRQSPFEILANVRFGGAMSMMLSIIERGGQAALAHNVMVSLLSICMANRLGLSEAEQTTVALAGLLHDIGELYIEPKYLQQDERLLPHEWRHVVVHPRIGQLLVVELEDYPAAVALAVAEHHERFDGSGYPSQAKGKHISVPGQILSVAEMISELVIEKDNPLERAELALKIIPNEHAYELVSAISSTLRGHPRAARGAAASDEANERAKILFDHISVVVETGDKMAELPRLQTAKGKDLLQKIVNRIDTIQRAFYSTGLDACEAADTAQNREILFEAIVATKEIQWRLRDVARDLALQSAALDQLEAEAFRPLIAMLDAEPDAKSLIRKIPAPGATDAKTGAARAVAPSEPPSAPARTLLLVDDEPNVLSSLNRILRPQGYRILTAANAALALDLLASNQVGVLLSDHRMPGMTGIELLSRVKTMYPMTVRMILSGYADVGTVTDAIRLGAVYKFLTKPWDADDLSDIIRRAFEKYEAEAFDEQPSARAGVA
ncbi:response regulator RpfG family c-di-GMP phosphodiesterase [Oxalobacteraceae bacterium GrIS 1.11]